eukprot:CAMPEP_0174856416 /NCGR_PEP_ID=MMETSP1114-20130205/35872_1 /TAXON_ID=312471 /ORGANISM="Neobodo designis, Strain CCAP 1951/1" /LENGTH=196 /DNA_ID=CAMNT_0016091211 /DNA_START=75 /DNA_END=665 /DNA_ORIENTATION=+
MRRTSVALAHPLTREVGVYLEDERNEYDTRVYYPMRFMKQWYAQREITHARSWLYQQRRTESVNAQNGLAFNGDGAFEREMKRKGVQVDKYPMPSTVATRRTRELILLRRQKLEQLSGDAMQRQREAKKAARPSAWYDEADGPLNPHFLHIAQKSYAEDITSLPETPFLAAEAVAAASSGPRVTEQTVSDADVESL